MTKPPINQVPGRKLKVEQMFNDIAYNYDLLNHILSFGIDKQWRKRLVKELSRNHPQHILDIATGTGDLAITASKINPQSIIAVDIASEMLEIAQQKITKKGLNHIISFQQADSERLPFADASFDAAMVAFGVRNYENLNKGLVEMNRVLKPGAFAFILEFSKPKNFLINQLYSFYSQYFMPFIGKLISKHASAYSYLPESVAVFPKNEDFLEEMKQAGFYQVHYRKLTFGITNLYIGQKL